MFMLKKKFTYLRMVWSFCVCVHLCVCVVHAVCTSTYWSVFLAAVFISMQRERKITLLMIISHSNDAFSLNFFFLFYVFLSAFISSVEKSLSLSNHKKSLLSYIPFKNIQNKQQWPSRKIKKNVKLIYF
jgi:hypothetical protein